MIHSSNFMDFWKILNDFAKSRGLSEILYREARDWFLEYQATHYQTVKLTER